MLGRRSKNSAAAIRATTTHARLEAQASAHCGQYRQAAGVGAAASAKRQDLIEDQLLNVIRACGTK